MIELLFLLGFSLHNIEEAIWLPKWSKHAKKFHKEVSQNEFNFAVIIITTFGYLLTFQYLILADGFSLSKYIYLGFISMMVLNAIFPHLLSSIVLKKYCPGTITGLILNMPIGIYLLYHNIRNFEDLIFVVVSFFIITISTLISLKYLFILGNKIVKY
jgi:hypothetical protein